MDQTTSEVAPLLAKVAAEVRERVEGPAPDLAKELVRHGRPALHAALVEMRTGVPADCPLPWQTVLENWQLVLSAFAENDPLLVAEAFQQPEPRYDTGALISALASRPAPSVAPMFIVLLTDRSAWVREHAIKGLVRLRWEPAITALLNYIDEHPQRDEVGVVLRGMYEWPALRRGGAPAALRRVAEAHAERKPGITSMARELADCNERGAEPPPRPSWWFAV